MDRGDRRRGSTRRASPCSAGGCRADERAYVRRLVPHVQLEEWDGRGHFVHLADADRFAARLRHFAAAL